MRRPTPPQAPPIRIGFGEVRHARLRPAKNAFRYGVFSLLLPLRSLGAAGAAGDGGHRLFSRDRFNLVSFHERDHGDGKTPLLPWLDAQLRAAGVHDADGEAWLQAFPRVLGYVFNPASFFFCHRKDGALRAVLAEVNNTFGERTWYLLEEGEPLQWGAELRAAKAMHVSPFCLPEGEYRFRFLRTERREGGAPVERMVTRIEYLDRHGPLITASVCGRLQPLSDRALAWACARYPLMTLAVMARIHWQALKLFAKRVPFFGKNPPTTTTTNETRT